jgi:hypothetical protein
MHRNTDFILSRTTRIRQADRHRASFFFQPQTDEKPLAERSLGFDKASPLR